MAHIPYGYRIVKGRAVIDPVQEAKIRHFLSSYFEGHSIQISGEMACIRKSRSTLTKLLTSPLYLGTDYYPPLLTEDLFEALQIEYRRRSRPGRITPAAISKEERTFRLLPIRRKDLPGNAKDAAEYLYSRIRPNAYAKEALTPTEANRLARLLSDNAHMEKEGSPWKSP